MNRWLTPDQINQLADNPAHCTRTELLFSVDSWRPFVPEHYTQLYYTPLYASLHYEHRLRYNQLFGLRLNEYIMMLEADLVDGLLAPLRRHPKIAGEAGLVTAIDRMIDEERRHYAFFAALNRACRPDLYPIGQDRYFSRLPLWTRAMFWTAGALAGSLAFSLWYQMAMEESSMSLARDMARNTETETMGLLDPAFTSAHLEHMKDESRHLHIDSIMIDLCIASASPPRRRLNAWLFQAMLTGVTQPTRGGSGVKVIRQLVRDMPELGAREGELIDAVLALGDDRRFQESLFNRRIMPLTFQVFDRTEELAALGKRMVGYDRR